MKMVERRGPDARDSGDRQIAESLEKGDKHSTAIYQLTMMPHLGGNESSLKPLSKHPVSQITFLFNH
jgi:hypothetical protein